MIFRNAPEITLRFYEKNYEKLGEIKSIEDFMTYVHMCDYLKIPTLLKNMLKYIIDNNIKGTDYKTLHLDYAKTSPTLIEQIRCISIIHKHGICDMMAIRGYKKCLEYSKDFNMTWTENNISNALTYKQFDCFIYLIENGCPCDYDASLLTLIRFKNLDLIKFIYKKCTKSNKLFVNEAAKVGCLLILIFLICNGFEFDEEAYFKAIENGNLCCVRLFQSKHYPQIRQKHLNIALNANRQNVVNFFEEHKNFFVEDVLSEKNSSDTNSENNLSDTNSENSSSDTSSLAQPENHSLDNPEKNYKTLEEENVSNSKRNTQILTEKQITQKPKNDATKKTNPQKTIPLKIIVKSESEKSLDLLKETLKINQPIKTMNQNVETVTQPSGFVSQHSGIVSLPSGTDNKHPITLTQHQGPLNRSPRPGEKTSFDINEDYENKLLYSLKKTPENNVNIEYIKNMFLNHPNKDKKFTKEAALNNNYELLKLLLKNGYAFDKSILEIAATNGFIKILDVLIENKIPLNVQVCNIALKAKQKKCLEYLIEKKCPGYQLFIKPLSDMV